DQNKLNREFKVQLEHGVTIGGTVQTPDGEPIAGAEVAPYKVVKANAREYSRTDHDAVLTDAQGKWSTTSLPPGFSGFSFQVSHPDYRPALYVMPGTVETPANNANANANLPGNLRIETLSERGAVMIEEDDNGRITRRTVNRGTPSLARPVKIPEVTS